VHNHVDISERLLDHIEQIEASDINFVDSCKQTALHVACFSNHSACVQLLVDAGIDHTIKNYAGKTALQIAEEEQHLECINILEQVCLSRAQLR
jgi:ankyrin repeat protein